MPHCLKVSEQEKNKSVFHKMTYGWYKTFIICCPHCFGSLGCGYSVYRRREKKTNKGIRQRRFWNCGFSQVQYWYKPIGERVYRSLCIYVGNIAHDTRLGLYLRKWSIAGSARSVCCSNNAVIPKDALQQTVTYNRFVGTNVSALLCVTKLAHQLSDFLPTNCSVSL